MDDKFQEITRKIYEEGVNKAKKEGEEILEKAKDDAEAIAAKAKFDAEMLKKQAEKEAEQLKSRILSETRMAGNQAVSLIKQEITDLLSGAALSKEIKTAFDDPEFTKTLIAEMITKGDFSGEDIDLAITLPERFQKELLEHFKNRLAHVLASGVEISFQSRMDGGFKIGPKDKSFILSFTDRDFNQYFQSFLKPKAKEILFPGA